MPMSMLYKENSLTRMASHLFCICTIANNLEQYEQMRQSFLEAGFTEERCRFVLLDNSASNIFEPYGTINQVLDEATEPYVIACHQDILLDQGHGFDQLMAQIDLLDRQYPNWAVSGNAGCQSNLLFANHLHDPSGFQRLADLPQQVRTLDENFLLIRRASGVRCSAELSGFHLYATDLCLNAAQHGMPCFVIDFYITHMSSGSADSDHFRAGLHEFRQHWNSRFLFRLIQTPCIMFPLSRYEAVRHLLAKPYGMLLARGFYKCGRIAEPLSRILTQ